MDEHGATDISGLENEITDEVIERKENDLDESHHEVLQRGELAEDS